MARCGKYHRELVLGFAGRCSVPMWQGGVPADFCDDPAFGRPEERQRRYEGYVPGLACYGHGGPSPPIKTVSITLSLDGDQYCALYGENIQEGQAGFGDTPKQAIQDLIKIMP